MPDSSLEVPRFGRYPTPGSFAITRGAVYRPFCLDPTGKLFGFTGSPVTSSQLWLFPFSTELVRKIYFRGVQGNNLQQAITARTK